MATMTRSRSTEYIVFYFIIDIYHGGASISSVYAADAFTCKSKAFFTVASSYTPRIKPSMYGFQSLARALTNQSPTCVTVRPV